MASISRNPGSDWYIVMFRYGGRQYRKGLDTTDPAEAERQKASIETVLDELKRGRKTLPANGDLWEFVRSDGQRTEKVKAPQVVSLTSLFDRYENEMPPGTMEENSLYTFRLHRKHLLRLLGGRTEAPKLSTSDMQRYINDRAREKFRGKTISPRTIKKEVATLRAVWNWGTLHGTVAGTAPTRGLRYEKEHEAVGFKTWEEIERMVERGASTELWNALFLTAEQTAECLAYVRQVDAQPFVYPMFVFIAYTGARRSEMQRSRVEDIDFESRRILIREKKKDRTKKETSRYVEMTPLLEQVLKDWLSCKHPGGPYTFCQSEVVARSRTRGRRTGHQSGPGRATTTRGRAATLRGRTNRPGHVPLTKNEATYHFKRALAGSKWAVVRGFHVFRHSFASNLARNDTRQEVIDGLMGHQTEDMRKRYRHLFPTETADAVRKTYG